jgi:hypothetical protein
MPSIDILSDAKNNILMLPIEREDVIPLIAAINMLEKNSKIDMSRLRLRLEYLKKCLEETYKEVKDEA